MSLAPAMRTRDEDVVAAVVKLPRALPRAMGMGAHLKASLCLIDGDEAFVTHPTGDMETLEAVELYAAMLDEVLARAGGAGALACAAHDLHPDFHSTHYATELGCATLGVQHHHAHILATAYEHGHTGPVLGLALDGFGLGTDGGSWGGELLHVDGLDFSRLGHLSLLAQPGGDIAAREPWRMGAAALHVMGRGGEISARFSAHAHAGPLAAMLDRKLNCPETSSCGRLFDAACGLLGVRPVAEFEGQAPMELEALATDPSVLTNGWKIREDGVLDLSALLAVLPGMDAAQGANLFHGTLAAALADWVFDARAATGIITVAFGGGCFFNRVLSRRLYRALNDAGMRVLMPERLSPGDAGLSFGQAIAAALAVERK